MDASMSITGQASPLGVTSFTEEACEEVVALRSYSFSEYLDSTGTEQSLIEYFSRPRCIAVGTLPSAGTQASVFSYAITRANLATAFPQWNDRLSGVYGIKFNTRIRFQVAATPFHQGVYALAAQYGDLNEGLSTSTKFNRVTAPYASTNLPHVRLDLTELTMVELVVPFYYVYEFMTVSADNVTSNADVATIGITSIVPTNTVATLAPPTYKVYISLEDIELYGADNAAITAITLQSGGTIRGFHESGLMIEELKKTKAISTGLDNGVKVANFVARHVPAVSAVAGPTAWALGIASGIAKYFGFSKPLSNTAVVKVSRCNHVQEVNVDIPSECTNVALLSENTLAFSKNFSCSDVDEMALKFITSQYSQICLGQVSTTDLHADVIYASPVMPSAYWFRRPASRPYCNKVHPRDSADLVAQTGNAFYPSSLMNISSMFRSWRGSTKFRFTFGKTKYHAGRYMVSFNPSVFAAVNPSGVSSIVDGPEVTSSRVQPYGYSMIMDLKDSNVFEFEVPYMSPYIYADFYTSIGGLSVVCIDPLLAPASVTSAVPLLVEVAGGEDFELADYSGCLFITNPNAVVYSQAGGKISDGALTLKSTTSTPCEDTMGECVTSAKQIIMSPVYSTNQRTAAIETFYNAVIPWWVNTNLQLTPSIPLPTNYNWNGTGYAPAYIASMYAFVRGGTEFHAYTSNVGYHFVQQRQLSGLLILPVIGTPFQNSAVKGYVNRWSSSATPKILACSDQPLHARCPSYQRVTRLPAWTLGGQFSTTGRVPGVYGGTGTMHGFGWLSHITEYVMRKSAADATYTTSSCAAEDAMCAGYLGPEPVLIVNSATPGAVSQEPTWVVGGGAIA